jgi:hypothetical protein
MTTRMVSPKPLSVFVPDVTLIAFPIPARLYPHGGGTLSSRESNVRSRQENGLDIEVEGHSGGNLNRPWFGIIAAAF